jgi:hypothetical protein
MLTTRVAQGSKNGAVPAQEEASGALGSLARGHPPNQDAVRAAGAIARLISLVTSGTPAVRVQLPWHQISSLCADCVFNPSSTLNPNPPFHSPRKIIL